MHNYGVREAEKFFVQCIDFRQVHYEKILSLQNYRWVITEVFSCVHMQTLCSMCSVHFGVFSVFGDIMGTILDLQYIRAYW